jgi:predicted ATPase/class 3 adenylate cyclase
VSQVETAELVDRAFLFTDLQGSTRAWEHSPTVMNEVVAEHDRVLRDSIAECDGEVISEAGDAFVAAFASPPLALDAAVRAQRALAAGTWPEGLAPRVRMGVHWGPAYPRGNNYFGSTLNRAARLMSAAHGHQIVVSGEVARIVLDEPAITIDLRDLGTHRFKDVAEPMSVWQVVAEGLPREFPPLTSLDAVRVEVPRSRTRFVGREAELAELDRLLRQPVVVTLVAAGGTGKTRLAYEAALVAGAWLPDGAVAVELADGREEDVVPRTLEAVLGGVPLARVAASAEPLAALVEHLQGRRALLVVDNCEHVIDAVRDLLTHLARSCPELGVLATSREPLGVEGERVVRLDGLGRDPAVALFLDRAEAAGGPGIANTELAAVADICAKVDGSPLAIELAAARTTALTPGQIAERLADGLDVLRRRQGAERHRSLEAAIAWSYDLLDEDERALLEVLSIFVGGADLAAAEAVGGQAVEGVVLDLLESLVDKSLVATELVGREVRFRLPAPIRRYARARLDERGGVKAAEQAHFDHFLGVAKSVVPSIDLDAAPTLVERLTAEHGNFLAAIERATAAGVPGNAARLALNLHTYWEETGHLAVGAETLAGILDAAPNDPAVLPVLGALVPYEAMCGRLDRARNRAGLLTAGLELGLPPIVTSRVRFALGFVDQAAGALSTATDLWQRAAEDAADAEHPFARQVFFSAAYTALMAEDLDRADALLFEARTVPPPVQGWFESTAGVVAAVTTIMRGGEKGVDELQAHLDMVDAMGLRFRAVLADVAGALGLYAADRPDLAEAWWRRGLSLSRDMGHLWASWVLLELASWSLDPPLAALSRSAVDRFAADRGYGAWPLITTVGADRRPPEGTEAVPPFTELVDAVLAT